MHLNNERKCFSVEDDIRQSSVINLVPRSLFGPFFFQNMINKSGNLSVEKRCLNCIYHHGSSIYCCQPDPLNSFLYKDFVVGVCNYYCKNDLKTFVAIKAKVLQLISQCSGSTIAEMWKTTGSGITSIISTFCRKNSSVTGIILKLNFRINEHLDGNMSDIDTQLNLKDMITLLENLKKELSNKKYSRSTTSRCEKDILLSYTEFLDKMITLLI